MTPIWAYLGRLFSRLAWYCQMKAFKTELDELIEELDNRQGELPLLSPTDAAREVS